MTWRTIESAPRDGTRIDVWEVSPSSRLSGGVASRTIDVWFENGAWVEWGEDGLIQLEDAHWKVTHWMPLPDPPTIEE